MQGSDSISLPQKVAALCRPETYPEMPARVEVIETHMSYVFLTSTRAYKLKKPVRYDYLDYTSLELRRHFCEEELRLNQRLAPGIYLAVDALALGPNGHMRVGGQGAVADWLVCMQRLPREHMLDKRIRRGDITAHELSRLAARLTQFYQSCAAERISATEYGERLAAEIELDRAAFETHGDLLGRCEVSETTSLLLKYVEQWRSVFAQRVAAGRIVEGHGDLRPEHVCLLDEPVVFDCLEFNRRLRIVDPTDELAFLAMECERLGAGHVGETLLREYAERSGDAAPAALLVFYKARRASVRARLSILHITGEVDWPPQAHWVALARWYLTISREYGHRLNALGRELGE